MKRYVFGLLCLFVTATPLIVLGLRKILPKHCPPNGMTLILLDLQGSFVIRH